MRFLALSVLTSMLFGLPASAATVTCGAYFSIAQQMCVGDPTIVNVPIPSDPGFTTAYILTVSATINHTNGIENRTPNWGSFFNHLAMMRVFERISISTEVGGTTHSLELPPTQQDISGFAGNRAASFDGAIDFAGRSGDVIIVNNGTETTATYSTVISDTDMVAALQTTTSAAIQLSCCAGLYIEGSGSYTLVGDPYLNIEAQLIKIGK